MRWGLLGAGDIVRKRVAAALLETPRSELVALSRARADLAEPFAASVGARRWHAQWRDLVADPEVDAVYIATPVHLHAEQTIAAAEAGKHVLCEKPMAMTAADCDAMIAACRAHSVRLGVAYYRRFYPAVVRIRHLLDAGAIGRPIVAQVNAFERFNPHPGDPRYWLVTAAQAGGGPMMDFGCHRIEILIHLFGAVRATSGTTAKTVFDWEVEDTATATLLFETGTTAVVTVTRAVMESRDTFDIFGTDGSIHVGALNRGDVRILTREGEHEELLPPHPNLHAPLVADFVDALTSGREPAVTGETGRAVAAIEDAIYGRTPVTPGAGA